MAIKVFYSDQAGAPVLNGVVGSLIGVLDACLVTGYNQVAVSSITRVGNIATVQTVTPHGYGNPMDSYWVKPGVGDIATIAGADQAAYNGEWPITYISPTSFSYDLGSATPDATATGVITTKRAPAGFSKAFADTNKAAYRSNDITGKRMYLQVNDTADATNSLGARFAWWRGYEKMSGIDTGEFPFPALTQSGVQGQFIRKSNALDANSRRWTLISDGKAFFLGTHNDVAGSGRGVSSNGGGSWFGDYLSVAPDPYAVFIDGDTNGATSPTTTTSAGLFLPSGQMSPNPGVEAGWSCIARRFNGQGKPVWAAGKLGHGLAQYCFGQVAYLTYPDPFGNRLYLSQIKLFEGAVLRGTLPCYEGMSGILHSDREIVENVVGLEGRQLVYIRGSNFHSSYAGGLYFDLTGNENGKWS